MKRAAEPHELTLESIDEAAQWARAHLAARTQPGAKHRDDPLEELTLWTIRELLRIELLLITRAADPALIDRLADTRAALASVTWIGDYDDNPMSLVAHALERWGKRAPGDCDDALAFGARSRWWVLRRSAARTLRLDHPPSLALLEALARDADDSIKREAAKRLVERRELPYWSVAFTKDPLSTLSARAAKALHKPVATVCESFAVTEYEFGDAREAREKRVAKRYPKALEALSDELLFDHANVVFSATGAMDERALMLLEALGARGGSLPLFHRALMRDPSNTYEAQRAQTRYFARFAERSSRDRAQATLDHIRWFVERPRDQSAVSLLAYSLRWRALWPARTSLRPLFALIVELGSQRESRCLLDVVKAFGTEAMPAEVREPLIASWSRGERSRIDRTIDRESLATALPPRSRWKWVETILRERRSTTAMCWALEQHTGALFSDRRDGSRQALARKLCEDPGLRGAVLARDTLTARCIEPLRERFNQGAITRRDELRRFVATLRDVTGEISWANRWFSAFRGGGVRLDLKNPKRADAAAFCTDRESLDPITTGERARIRALRRAALREKGSEADALDAELFSAEPWREDDLEDFAVLCEQLLEGGAYFDHQFLACMIDHQWRVELRPQAEAVIAALERSDEHNTAEWIARLRANFE